MAAPVVQSSPNADNANAEANVESVTTDSEESESKSELKMDEIADMLSKLKLNPLAKEFFPSSHQDRNRDQFAGDDSSPDNKHLENYGFPNNRRRRNNYNHGRKRVNGRAFRAQREDNIRRTVYVSEIDHFVTEERLAALFNSQCGQRKEDGGGGGSGPEVVDCRICGDPHSHLRFAFVEFADEGSAKGALNFSGTIIGFYPIRVLPSKTAILPVNPTFLPRSEDEREMCARTVYCTNIDKEAESAIAALNCSGTVLGTQPIRVSPSKTPVRGTVVHGATTGYTAVHGIAVFSSTVLGKSRISKEEKGNGLAIPKDTIPSCMSPYDMFSYMDPGKHDFLKEQVDDQLPIQEDLISPTPDSIADESGQNSSSNQAANSDNDPY
ncbi:hypothetical protein Acr_23g0007320 [Actinidia rufa]|uniref:RRM domain-containing protein n=1 Tax=Actinidia rufa TaxID=165716 RepID=A0A7J0GNF9_9ERIC|nr:hypothetical protein Acr_23g0007320 [Actinidia rufa]